MLSSGDRNREPKPTAFRVRKQRERRLDAHGERVLWSARLERRIPSLRDTAVDRPRMALPSLLEVDVIASRQAAELRARCGYGVGRLTIATITRQGITILPPREIAPVPHADAGEGAAPALWEGSSKAGEATPSITLAA